MADNVIKSTDVNSAQKKPAKKAAAKKAAPKKVQPESVDEGDVVETHAPSVLDGFMVVVFESGASYTSNGIRFTKDSRVQEVPVEDAQRLLMLDNFRLPNQFELEDYFNSKEG